MLYKGPLTTQASGSIGGITASHNKGGQYFRARTVPTNPNSSFQQAVRQIMGNLASHWVSTLTDALRDGWSDYAANVTFVNPLGDTINLSGLNCYQRVNVPYIQAGGTRIDTPPSIYTLGEFTEPTLAVSASADTVDVTFDNGDDWANEDDSLMLVYASRPQNDTVNYFKGPYRYAGKIEGDSVTAPTSPATLNLPFDVAAGQRIFIRIQVVRADGRLSASFRGTAKAV